MTECDKVCDMLVDYINRRLPPSENGEIVKHLACCESCRLEAATLIKIKDLVQAGMSPVPQDVLDSAFRKIPKKEELVYDMLNPGTYFSMVFDLISYSLSPVRQIIRLAEQAM